MSVNSLSYTNPMGLEVVVLLSWFITPDFLPKIGLGFGAGASHLFYSSILCNGECPPGGCYYARDEMDKPKDKAGNFSEGSIVRTPTTYPDDFVSAGYGDRKNTNTGEIWSPSNTNYSNLDGVEWKAGPKPGVPPKKENKITVSDGGTIIKIDK